MILIQCLVFGGEEKIFEPSQRLPVLQYDIIMIDFLLPESYCIWDTFLTKFNHLQSLKLLSLLAVLRLDDDDDIDNIEKTLTVALMDSSSSSVKNKSIMKVDPLASSTWEQVHFYYC